MGMMIIHMGMIIQISEQGLELIRHFEGCRLMAYQDPVGVWTIGYGHTSGVQTGQLITLEQAEALLLADLQPITAFLGQRAMTQGQFDALCSFAFNLGLGALSGSTLWRLFLEDQPAGVVAQQFSRWVYAGGKVLPGLVRRREAEARLFLS